jgi:hypothetical protein
MDFDLAWESPQSKKDDEVVTFEDAMGNEISETLQPIPYPSSQEMGFSETDSRRLDVHTGQTIWAIKGMEVENKDMFDMDVIGHGQNIDSNTKLRMESIVSNNREGVQHVSEKETFSQRDDMYNGYNLRVSNQKSTLHIPTNRGNHDWMVFGVGGHGDEKGGVAGTVEVANKVGVYQADDVISQGRNSEIVKQTSNKMGEFRMARADASERQTPGQGRLLTSTNKNGIASRFAKAYRDRQYSVPVNNLKTFDVDSVAERTAVLLNRFDDVNNNQQPRPSKIDRGTYISNPSQDVEGKRDSTAAILAYKKTYAYESAAVGALPNFGSGDSQTRRNAHILQPAFNQDNKVNPSIKPSLRKAYAELATPTKNRVTHRKAFDAARGRDSHSDSQRASRYVADTYETSHPNPNATISRMVRNNSIMPLSNTRGRGETHHVRTAQSTTNARLGGNYGSDVFDNTTQNKTRHTQMGIRQTVQSVIGNLLRVKDQTTALETRPEMSTISNPVPFGISNERPLRNNGSLFATHALASGGRGVNAPKPFVDSKGMTRIGRDIEKRLNQGVATQLPPTVPLYEHMGRRIT